jgi:voltage-gated potassium channel Kch
VSTTITLFGIALIAVALRDIFQELFRPSGGGVLSLWLMRLVWKGFRLAATRRPALLELAGPAMLLAVIGTWSSLVAVGFALVYWPRLPASFLFSTGLEPSANAGIIDALYLSAVTLGTLGYGDIAPASEWLRLLAPIEAMIGFGILTAAISWVLSIYPVLSRRRSLVCEVALLRKVEQDVGTAVEHLGSGEVARIFEALTSRVTALEGDLVQFPVTYYFHNTEERNSLPAALPYLLRLAEKAGGEGSAPEVRLRAVMLRGAIEDFSNRLASKAFLGLEAASTEKVLWAYADDHLQARKKDPGLPHQS